MNKITTINGIPMVMQDDFFRHTEDTTIHVTAEEKEKWNGPISLSRMTGRSSALRL